MLANVELLNSKVVLQHFPEVDSSGLADSLVPWVFDVEHLKRVVRAVKHAEDADHSVMVNFIVAKVEL